MQKHEWYSDTHAFEVFLARQRSMPPAEKMQAVIEPEARQRQFHPGKAVAFAPLAECGISWR